MGPVGRGDTCRLVGEAGTRFAEIGKKDGGDANDDRVICCHLLGRRTRHDPEMGMVGVSVLVGQHGDRIVGMLVASVVVGTPDSTASRRPHSSSMQTTAARARAGVNSDAFAA